MSKSTKNILIVIIIILLIFGITLAIYNNFKSKPMNADVEKDNILDDANSGLENLINGIFNEEITNNEEDVKQNDTVENTQSTNTQSTNTSNKEQSSDKKDGHLVENQTTPGEQKAIELVKAEWKKEWGSLDEVSFNNVMIQGDGKYVVSVNDNKTTRVIHRYVVDTATGVVEEKD